LGPREIFNWEVGSGAGKVKIKPEKTIPERQKKVPGLTGLIFSHFKKGIRPVKRVGRP